MLLLLLCCTLRWRARCIPPTALAHFHNHDRDRDRPDDDDKVDDQNDGDDVLDDYERRCTRCRADDGSWISRRSCCRVCRCLLRARPRLFSLDVPLESSIASYHGFSSSFFSVFEIANDILSIPLLPPQHSTSCSWKGYIPTTYAVHNSYVFHPLFRLSGLQLCFLS